MKYSIKGVLFCGMILMLSGFAAADFNPPPIRVLIFTPCGPDSYLHPEFMSQMRSIVKMLQNPAAANLKLSASEIPSEGFKVDSIVTPTGWGTTAQGDSLLARLPYTDVVITLNNTGIDGLFTDSAKAKFVAWNRAYNGYSGQGIVMMSHTSTEFQFRWPQWPDSLLGPIITRHFEGPATILADSLPDNVNDDGYKRINAGLGKSYKYRLNQHWYFYPINPRSLPGAHILTTVDERDFTAPNEGMADHPVCWYRASDDYWSGRTYYSGLGWDAADYDTSYVLRRQLYNAIVWASERSSDVSVKAKKPAKAKTVSAQVSGSSINISVLREGVSTTEIEGVDGRQVEQESQQGYSHH